MPLVPAKCPECGGNVVVDNEKDAWVCDFCKTPFIVEKAINSFNTINNTTNNVTNNNDIRADVVNVYESKNQDFVIKAGELVEYNGTSMDVVIPEEVVAIGYKVFSGSNIHSITLHNNISRGMSFSGCINLENVTLPESMVGILPYFGGCSSLKEITIPAGISSIPSGAFWSCSALKKIILPAGISSIPENAFRECSSLEEIILPAEVSGIAPNAFRGCSSLKQIHLPENLKEIGQFAFTNCKSLERIKLPDSLESIPDKPIRGLGAFGGCDSLFEGCESLKEVVLPDSIDRIGKRMFCNCKSLESITANGVRNIETGAFKNCVSLEKIPEFPMLTRVGDWGDRDNTEGAFQGCSALKRVVLNANIEWEYNTFRDCSSLQEVYIDGVMSIEPGVFLGCRNIRNINIENIESINDYAFDQDSYVMNVLVRNNFTPPEYAGRYWENKKIAEYKVMENAKLASEIFYRRMERYIHRPLENRKTCPICNMPTLNSKKGCLYTYCPIRKQDPEEAIKGMTMNISRGLCPSCGAKLDMLVASISNDNKSHLMLECNNKYCRLRDIKGWRD